MTEEAFDLALLQQWVGRTEVKQDVIQPGLAEALAATLDRAAPAAGLPPLWHWIYFWTAVPASEIGADGHPHGVAGLHPQRGRRLVDVPDQRAEDQGWCVHGVRSTRTASGSHQRPGGE